MSVQGIHNSSIPQWDSLGIEGLGSAQAAASAKGADGIPAAQEPSASASDKPELASSSKAAPDLERLARGLGASFGADAMATLSEALEEMRLNADEQRLAESKAVTDQMKKEAAEMRKNAQNAFICAMVSAGISLGASIFSTVSSARALKGSKLDANATGVDKETAASQLHAKSQLNEAITGLINVNAQVTNAVKDYLNGMGEAKIKEMEAGIESKRAMVETLRSLSETLSEVIQKAVSTQTELQESINQTRTKILS